MRRQLLALTFVALPLALALSAGTADLKVRATSEVRVSATSQVAQAFRPAGSSGIEIDALDRKIDPCTDFYQFACGGWVAKNPLPADRRSFGRFQEVQERNFILLRRILETPGGDGDRKKAADYYAACMDEPRIEANGLAAIGAELATIGEILNPDDLPVLVAHLHAYGIPALFRFGAQTDLEEATHAIANVDQAGLGLPDRDYYLNTDERSVA
jgi:predicted metalloendopeptidase